MPVATLLVALGTIVATSSIARFHRSSSQPSRSKASAGLTGVSVHGMGANLTDDQLALRVPLIVIGTVVASRQTRFIDDPDLPSGWSSDPETAAIVNGGAGHIVSTVDVEQWLKGTSSATIYVEQGTQGNGIAAAGSSTSFNFLTGHRYKFWLSVDPWFQGNYWLLERGLALT